MKHRYTGKPYIIKKWATIKLADANLDARTLHYIEYLTQLKGQEALDKYLKWTGWYDIGQGSNAKRKQTPIEHRLFRAAMLAPTVRWNR
jgi:hypothetical protein